MQFIIYFILVQCLILHDQYVMALVGPGVRVADLHEFPAVVSILILDNTTELRMEAYHKCTGTLVSRQDVITAEHCSRNILTIGFKIRYGSSDLYETSEIYPMFFWTYEQWMIHKQRTIDETYHDIAIIKLLGNVAETIQIAPVGNSENRFLYGLDVVTAGWGKRDNELKPRYLHAVALKVLTKEQCEARYYDLTKEEVDIDIQIICTVGNPPGLLYQGDSGGPLFFFGTLVAVNHGVSPHVHGKPRRNQINLHYGIRYYYEFYQDILSTFHMNY